TTRLTITGFQTRGHLPVLMKRTSINTCNMRPIIMQLQSTYTDAGWDFADVWKVSAGEYPKLMWQN
ncbi:MAG: hypothetical protein JW841_12870, partial [Deltaproteobacteria bacterium]|nr:hypothetical protein [Deltaproteobacteria bacterium]